MAKKQPANPERLAKAADVLAEVDALCPDLAAELPRAMHPVVGDLRESAAAVRGYLIKTSPPKKP